MVVLENIKVKKGIGELTVYFQQVIWGYIEDQMQIILSYCFVGITNFLETH